MSSIRSEMYRLILIVLAVVLLGSSTGYWLLPLIIALILYLVWNLYKLHQLETWALDGFEPDKMPHSDGIWASISNRIFSLKKQTTANKARQVSILKQFSKVVSSLPTGALVINQRHEIQWLNKDAARLFKLHHKKDLGNNLLNLIRVPKLNSALQNKGKQRLKVSSPHDENIMLGLNISKLRQKTRMIVVRDISLQQQLEDSRKSFVANASHELKTPLTVIIGYLEMLKQKIESDGKTKKMLAGAYKQAQKMNKLIDDLLILSKLEYRELSNRKTSSISMAVIINDIIKDIKPTSGSEHIIDSELEPELKITGSESELYSLVENLINNAINHTPVGSKIKVIWRRYQDIAILTVLDNGSGIFAEELPHLTERFYQVNKSNIKSGSGLGLSIVKHVAQRHGANLDIQSEPGEFTSFSVEFPEYRLR